MKTTRFTWRVVDSLSEEGTFLQKGFLEERNGYFGRELLMAHRNSRGTAGSLSECCTAWADTRTGLCLKGA